MFKKILTTSILAVSALSVFSISINATNTNLELTADNTIETYYKDVNTSLKGEAFIDNLTPIINAGFKSHSYDAAKKIIAESDRDPQNPNKVICFYTGDSLSEGQWNREHVWAKSHGFPSKSFNAYSDAHHLRPTLVKINSTRGSKDFGEVVNGSTDGKGNYWSGNTFEPRDEVKGDVARIMFYMVTKYNNVNNLKLTLTNNVPTSGSTGNGKFGHLDTLIKWHYEDPVSDFERNRNEVVYSYQNNRNPYIDHPEYVDLAFNTNSDVSVDNKKVESVVNQIKSLPEVITLDLKTTVYEIKALYDALNYKEKELVTNYNVLENAINKIKELEGNIDKPVNPDKPILPESSDKIAIDFNNVGDFSYTLDKEINVSNYNFMTNAAYAKTNDFRVGHNKQNLKIDPKYGYEEDKDVAVIESLFSVNNISGLNLNVKSVYGGANNLSVLVGNNGNYEVVKQQIAINPDSSVNVTFDKVVSGNLVLVFTGGLKPRVTLSNLEILTSKVDSGETSNNPLKYTDINTSLRFKLTDNKLTDGGLRFGGIFDKKLFEGATDFGVITVKTSDLNNKTINSLNNEMSLAKLKENFSTNNIKYLVSSSFETKHEVNDKYQFALVINNILEMPKEDLTSVIYMVKDNKLYLSTEKTMSFFNCLIETKKDSSLSESDIKLLELAISLL